MPRLCNKLSVFIYFILLSLFAVVLPTSTILAADNFATWQNQTNLPYQLASHEAIIYNDKIYFFGGSTFIAFSGIYSTQINQDGTLGSWELKGNLPTTLQWHNVLLQGNRIYILGGVIESIPAGAPNSVDTVLTTTIDSNGNLGSWQTLTPMPKRLAEGYSAIYNNKIFYVGGAERTNGVYTRNANVYSTTINGDGTISNWSTESSLPQGRDGFNLFLVNNRLIVIGGELNGVAADAKVLSATIDNTGHLSNWESLPDMISPMRRAVSFYDGKNIYLLGGYNGSSFLTSIYSAELDNDNKPIQWVKDTHNLPSIICCSPGVLHNNIFYILGGHNGSQYISNVLSTTLTTTSTGLDVPDIKQYSDPWGDDEYDSASKWSPVPKKTTVARWGCAMTSADMILQYNGYDDVDPEDLNTWLKDNNGYDRNGGILWNAVSKYSKDHKNNYTPALKTLEFAYHSVNDNNIINELETHERPAIMKLQSATTSATHFIVAKGKVEKSNSNEIQDYVVNDPDSSTNTKLSEAKSSFKMDLNKYGIFTPSDSDLSYIVLLVDSNANLKVFDQNGSEITEGYQLEGPILGIDHDTNETELSNGGKSLRSFYLPKPTSGQYKVEVTGNGNYQLDSYLYDVDGNVNPQHSVDSVSNSNKDIYLLNFNHDANINSNTSGITFAALLTRLDTDYASGKISNVGAYTSIRNMIENAKIQYDKGSYLLSKQFLNSSILKIQYYSSIGGIDQTEALKLVQYIQLLGQTY